MSEETVYHVPVLLHPSVDGMNIRPGGIYVDVTFGGGGHSREILNRLDSTAHLYSFDQDEDAEKNILADPRFTFVRSNFRYLRNFMPFLLKMQDERCKKTAIRQIFLLYSDFSREHGPPSVQFDIKPG